MQSLPARSQVALSRLLALLRSRSHLPIGADRMLHVSTLRFGDCGPSSRCMFVLRNSSVRIVGSVDAAFIASCAVGRNAASSRHLAGATFGRRCVASHRIGYLRSAWHPLALFAYHAPSACAFAVLSAISGKHRAA